MIYELHKARDKKHKYYVIFKNKRIYFGAIGYSDFTKHKDITRRNAYDKRHGHEDWYDLNKAGTWAKWILWNKTTINKSILDMEKKFGITIKH